jgi:hypothetical protein
MSEAVYESFEMSAEEYERYRGKHVVIYKGRVISEGSSSVEAVKNALKKH